MQPRVKMVSMNITLISILDISLLMDYTFCIAQLRRTVMSNQSDDRPTTPVRPIPLIPIYAFSFLSALTVSLGLRFGQSARTALLGAGFLFAAIAVACFARFLLTADELFKDINYRALIFGFVSSLALALVLDFLRSLGAHVPAVPAFGIPVGMIILWTVGLVLAAIWQRAIAEREE
jgi:hypothetical protein